MLNCLNFVKVLWNHLILVHKKMTTSSEKLKMATLEHSLKAIARQNGSKWRPILRVNFKVGKNIGRTNWTIT